MSNTGDQMALQQINLEEINEITGYKRAEEHVWAAFSSTYLNASEEERDPDVDAWVDAFCEQAEQDGFVIDRNFVKSVCILGIYAGPRDEFQQRSGSGTAVYANGDRYEGEFFEGRKHGSGRYVFVSKGKSESDRLVEAEMQNVDGGAALDESSIVAVAKKYQLSHQIVAGIVEYGFFPCYHGDYIRGKRTGQGIMKNKDGTLYKGEFVENKREGQGVLYYTNGDIYSGNWKGGLKHGYGTYHFSGGGEYRGEWVKGIFTQGQWILPDGTYYEGRFDRKNRPFDTCATMHFPAIEAAQTGVFKRGVWAPTSAIQACTEVPVDGMAWAD